MNHAGGEDLAASDSEIERALLDLEENIPRSFATSVGSVIDGRYRVVDELGRGGFGRVFEVRHLNLGRRFAMKILHPSIAEDPDFVTRFQEEAKATSLIGHDNIVFVTDFGRCEENGYFLVMEYLDGERLTDILRRRKQLPLRQTLDCLVAVGSALSAVHALGIVHCDLKPANIMHARRPGNRHIWKVLDFGTASIVTGAVESESIFGTPKYMAPEHAIGWDVDPRADVFALGCVVYEMLAGHLPWETKGWFDAQPRARRNNPPRPLHEFVDEVDAATSDAVMRAIAVDYDKRWADVETFVAAFRDSAAVTYIPVGDSLDAVSDPKSFKRSKTAPVVSEVRREASLVIERPDLEATRWRMVFNTAERLRREYRRNMIARGLFVTGADSLPERDTMVKVVLAFEPTNAELEVEGRVVSHAHGNPKGFGLELTTTAHAALEYFLDKHGIRRTIGNAAMVEVVDEVPARKWTSGQAFVLAMCEEPISVAELRARATGLPFDVEEAIFSLSDLGIVAISDTQESRRRDFTEVTSARGPTSLAFESEDVERVMELANQFIDRGNFLAAQEVLERAAAVSEQPTPFLEALQRVKLAFSRDAASSVNIMSKSFSMLANDARGEDTRGRLQRILGTDPLDD
jgi:serine/threonine protein kinase